MLQRLTVLRTLVLVTKQDDVDFTYTYEHLNNSGIGCSYVEYLVHITPTL